MKFLVNTSPFAGQEGEFITSRNIKARLEKELERNLALPFGSKQLASWLQVVPPRRTHSETPSLRRRPLGLALISSCRSRSVWALATLRIQGVARVSPKQNARALATCQLVASRSPPRRQNTLDEETPSTLTMPRRSKVLGLAAVGVALLAASAASGAGAVDSASPAAPPPPAPPAPPPPRARLAAASEGEGRGKDPEEEEEEEEEP